MRLERTARRGAALAAALATSATVGGGGRGGALAAWRLPANPAVPKRARDSLWAVRHPSERMARALVSGTCCLCGAPWAGAVLQPWGVFAHADCVRGQLCNTFVPFPPCFVTKEQNRSEPAAHKRRSAARVRSGLACQIIMLVPGCLCHQVLPQDAARDRRDERRSAPAARTARWQRRAERCAERAAADRPGRLGPSPLRDPARVPRARQNIRG